MLSILGSWLVLALSVYATALLLPGFRIRTTTSALVVAALFGVLHYLLGWLFFTVFTVLTLGIAYLLAFITRIIISAIILVIVARVSTHLVLDGYRWALYGAVVMSLIGTAAQFTLRKMFVI